MVEAYRFAEGTASPPEEVALLGYIDRFGVGAVMGRSYLHVGEMRRMMTVENIITAYKSRKASENWAKWADEHTSYAELLATVERLLDAAD